MMQDPVVLSCHVTLSASIPQQVITGIGIGKCKRFVRVLEGQVELANATKQFRIPVMGHCIVRLQSECRIEDPFRTGVIVVGQEGLVDQ